MENSHSASPWQTLILQSFLSLYQISAKNTTSRDYFQGYDFVFDTIRTIRPKPPCPFCSIFQKMLSLVWMLAKSRP